MKLYVGFDKVVRFGRTQWIYCQGFTDKGSAERFVRINPGMVLKVFDEVEE